LKAGTGASQGTGSAATIAGRATEGAGDDDFIVTGLAHTPSNSGSSGVIGTITTYPNYDLMQVNNLSGCTAADVGKWLTSSGASDGGNNGEFPIVQYVSSSSLIVRNPSRVQGGAGTITWSVRQGPEEGNFLSIGGATSVENNGTYQIVKGLSATSCWIRMGANMTGTDAANGSLSWNHRDCTKQTIASVNTAGWDRGAWILLQGPRILKMPFATGVQGAAAFQRGERVIQAATGAEGLLLGITHDSTGAGWAIIDPQLKGEGTAYDDGWDLTSVAGLSSGATFTPTGVQRWEREVCIASDPAAANWYRGGYLTTTFIRKDTEQRQRLLIRSLNSACTSIVFPGSSSTSDADANTFPTKAFCVIGVVGGAYDYWTRTNQNPDTAIHGKAQISVANAIRREALCADGTFWYSQWLPAATYNGFFGLFRMDETEEGEVDPWAFYSMGVGSSGVDSAPTRVGMAAASADSPTRAGQFFNGYDTVRTHTVSRGLGTGESWESPCVGASGYWLGKPVSGFESSAVTSGTTMYPFTTWYAMTQNGEQRSSKGTRRIMERIWLGHRSTTLKYLKGVMRWAFIASWNGATNFSTFGGRQLVMLQGAAGSNQGSLPICVGPWDGVTDPVGT